MIGYKRLHEDIKFAEHMLDEFQKDKKYAFIRKQLSWLGLSDDNCDENMVEDVVLTEDVEKLEEYLETVVNEKLFIEQQQKLSDLILKELITLSTKIDYRTQLLKPNTLETILRNQLDLPYAVSKPKKETKGENRNKRYIVISKIS